MTNQRQPYPSDLTDFQCGTIVPFFTNMRNCKWPKRELVNAVLYVADNGCKWRNLPHDFPPHPTVYSFFRRAKISGLWDRILVKLVEITRKNADRINQPFLNAMLETVEATELLTSQFQ